MITHDTKQDATHLFKLLNKMNNYEMGPASIVRDTEWTRF